MPGLSLEAYLSTPVLEGERNNALFAAVMQARERGWTEARIRREIGGKARRDGLAHEEIDKTIRSAMKRSLDPAKCADWKFGPRRPGDGHGGGMAPAPNARIRRPRCGWVERPSLASNAAPSTADGLPPILSLQEFHEQMQVQPGPKPVVQDLLNPGQVFVITGPPKCGKSCLALQLAACVSTGVPWLKWQCNVGGILYVHSLLRWDFWERRQKLDTLFPAIYGTFHEYPIRDCDDALFRNRDELIRNVQRLTGIRLVVFDLDCRIYSDHAALKFARFAHRVASETGCAVCVVDNTEPCGLLEWADIGFVLDSLEGGQRGDFTARVEHSWMTPGDKDLRLFFEWPIWIRGPRLGVGV